MAEATPIPLFLWLIHIYLNKDSRVHLLMQMLGRCSHIEKKQ
jgi:hypothetical protein